MIQDGKGGDAATHAQDVDRRALLTRVAPGVLIGVAVTATARADTGGGAELALDALQKMIDEQSKTSDTDHQLPKVATILADAQCAIGNAVATMFRGDPAAVVKSFEAAAAEFSAALDVLYPLVKYRRFRSVLRDDVARDLLASKLFDALPTTQGDILAKVQRLATEAQAAARNIAGKKGTVGDLSTVVRNTADIEYLVLMLLKSFATA